MTKVLLSLGSNTGDSCLNLAEAIRHISALPSVSLSKASSVHTTPPWGRTDQPDFLNQSLLIDTDLSVADLMAFILSIEKKMGRVREEKWGPRLIDIDIILFGDEIVNTSEITVPHPLMQERYFVLAPSVEIAPEMNHPVLQRTIGELLLHFNSSSNLSSK